MFILRNWFVLVENLDNQSFQLEPFIFGVLDLLSSTNYSAFKYKLKKCLKADQICNGVNICCGCLGFVVV